MWRAEAGSVRVGRGAIWLALVWQIAIRFRRGMGSPVQKSRAALRFGLG